jgi:hypothetical protein
LLSVGFLVPRFQGHAYEATTEPSGRKPSTEDVELFKALLLLENIASSTETSTRTISDDREWCGAL